MNCNRTTLDRRARDFTVGSLLFVFASVLGTWLGLGAFRYTSAVNAQDKPLPNSARANAAPRSSMIVQVAVVDGKSRFVFCAEVDPQLHSKLTADEKALNWTAVAYRLSSDNQKVENFGEIGHAAVDSAGRVTIIVHDKGQSLMQSVRPALVSMNPLERQALILLPKGAASEGKTYAGSIKSAFAKEVEPDVMKGGLLLFPVEHGTSERRGTCTCKAFFGCTTGCCTNVTCQDSTIGGFCPSNSNCKKVDMTSNCNCD